MLDRVQLALAHKSKSARELIQVMPLELASKTARTRECDFALILYRTHIKIVRQKEENKPAQIIKYNFNSKISLKISKTVS